MGRKRKIDSLHQADGRDHSIEKRGPTKSVDEIFGYEKSKFKTSDAKVYEQDLSEMNKVDLQKEAAGLGLMPIDDRFVLKERIMNEFYKYDAALRCSKVQIKQIKVNKAGLAILSEGAN